MYIEIHDFQEFEQKALYFKLNNALNMNVSSESNKKIAGVYAIFKDDICLYVGLSKNLASRIATHMKGKYKSCTSIELFNIEDVGWKHFETLSTEVQNSILLNAEKYLMTKLKPIENLDIDMGFKIKEECTPNILYDKSLSYSYRMLPKISYLGIFDQNNSLFIDEVKDNIMFATHKNSPFPHTTIEDTEKLIENEFDLKVVA